VCSNDGLSAPVRRRSMVSSQRDSLTYTLTHTHTRKGTFTPPCGTVPHRIRCNTFSLSLSLSVRRCRPYSVASHVRHAVSCHSQETKNRTLATSGLAESRLPCCSLCPARRHVSTFIILYLRDVIVTVASVSESRQFCLFYAVATHDLHCTWSPSDVCSVTTLDTLPRLQLQGNSREVQQVTAEFMDETQRPADASPLGTPT